VFLLSEVLRTPVIASETAVWLLRGVVNNTQVDYVWLRHLGADCDDQLSVLNVRIRKDVRVPICPLHTSIRQLSNFGAEKSLGSPIY